MRIKKAEIADLIDFIEIFGVLDYEFGDKPDLVFQQDRKVIGVEHTRAYVNSAKLESGRQLLPQEKFHWNILDLARELFKQKSNMYLWVSASFVSPSNYRREDVFETAEPLAACLSKDR